MQPQQQDPDQTKNVILAVVLSLAVLFAWQMFYAGPKYKAEQERQRRIAEQQAQSQSVANPGAQTQASNATTQATEGPVPTPGAVVGGNAAPSVQNQAASRDAALAASQRVAIETPSLMGSINLTGGRIDDITLVKYHVEPDPESPRVVLFSPSNAPNPYFSEFGWVGAPGSSIETPKSDTVWTASDGARLTPDTPVQLTWTNPTGLTFTRTISVDADYMFTIRDTVENTSGAEVTLYPYGRIYRYGTPKIEGFFIQHEGLIGVLGEAGLTEITYGSAREEGGGQTLAEVNGGWLGFTDKYWAATLIPDQAKPFRANLSSPNPTPQLGRRETFQADFLQAPVVVGAGQTATVENRLYAGAKKVDIIEGYQESLGIKQFELMIDWGWFYFITKPLHYLLQFLFGLFGNFGVAILGVTIIVKAMFFYFANKSYESMAKMKKVQPEMKKIQERYKNDKAEQQKQLMALYQKEKINPLAGCLPVLIQIPVFFALYKVLFISIDMRHAPFFGWIQDLSAPDPTNLFNLFGLLPYTLPDWFPLLGIWPLFMGITMWLQMQLNPQQPDPVQQAVFNWMPVLFTFLLASFPAGLVIYWAWNNVLSLAQQYFIMKRQGVDVHLVDNIKKTGAAAKTAVADLKKLRPGSSGGSSSSAGSDKAD